MGVSPATDGVAGAPKRSVRRHVGGGLDDAELQAAATLVKLVAAEDLVSCAKLFNRAADAHPQSGATP